MRLIGHRGASHVAPENTLAAFRLALESGAGFEMDLQMTRTGEVVVLHDDTLRRTAPRAAAALLDRQCADIGLDQLRDIDVGSWFGEEWSGERVPTLASALQLLREKSAGRGGSQPEASPEVMAGAAHHCLAELKVEDDGSADPRLPGAAEAAVRASGVGPHVLSWITFSLPLAVEMKRRMPEHASLLLGHATTSEQAWSLARACVQEELDGLNLNADVKVVTAELADYLRAHGKQLSVWVWKAPAENDRKEVWEAMQQAGVHTFTSNLPPGAVSWWRQQSWQDYHGARPQGQPATAFSAPALARLFAVGILVSFMLYEFRGEFF